MMKNEFDIKKDEHIELQNGSQGHDEEVTVTQVAQKDFNLKVEIDLILEEKPNATMWMIEHKLIEKGFVARVEQECKTFFLGYAKNHPDTNALELYDQ